jgi:UDPglucose--hexose-1-phosphate uridylyltransferase
MSFDPAAHPHRRYDPLADRWLLVSPHRATRPWLGQQDAPDSDDRMAYDPACYLCPGNARSGGMVNPAYDGPYVFANDFPALLADGPQPSVSDPLFQAASASGEARVICFSPDHARTLPELSAEEVLAVINCWCDQVADLGQRYANVQVFENKGAMMGCSNPHPHGQVWATDYVPHEVATEDRTQADWLAKEGAPMLLALAQREAGGPRAVVETAHWIAIVPWWASWPYETLLLPRFKVARLPELTAEQRHDLAIAIRELTARYDNLFACAFPYSMGWHGAPFGAGGEAHWQLHAHFYPPLLRSASVRKFMVGYEMLAEAQRDITPEQAAERLKAQSPVHYRTVS